MKSSQPTWTHPELGIFVFDGSWCATVKSPDFDRFDYDTGYEHDRKTKGQYTLSFEAENEKDVPSLQAAELAARVLKASGLADVVVAALWHDFNGRGPDSGMWWHDDLDEVNEGLDALQSADDVYKVLRLFEIRVRQRGTADGKPLVELCFWAAFEPEHNVGVLTDGARVLGTGYQGDASLFEARED